MRTLPLIAMVAAVFAVGAAETVTLSPKTGPQCEIVTPFSPSKDVLDAARELRGHLERMTGGFFPITTVYGRIPGRYALYVGVGPGGRAVPAGTFAPGETLVAVESDRLVLAGDDESRGTSLAVCRFLYDACGVRWAASPMDTTVEPKRDKLVWEIGRRREKAASGADARTLSIDARMGRSAYTVTVYAKLPEGATVYWAPNVKKAMPPLGSEDILAGRPFSVSPKGLWGLDAKKGESHDRFLAMTTEPGFGGFWNAPMPKDRPIVYRCDVPVRKFRSLRILTREQMRSRFFFDLVGWRKGRQVALAKDVLLLNRANDLSAWEIVFDRETAPTDLEAIGWIERFGERKDVRNAPRYVRVLATEWQ